jgi:hypothetical protein
MMPDRLQRGLRTLAGIAGLALACAPLSAQTHKVAAPQVVVRAVGVYEWTGDMAKPTASRLIPISLYINGRFEDAAVYKPRPMPFAIETGNVYQLMKAGNVVGNLDLVFARHLVAAETNGSAYDDGWFGYGKFVPPSAAKKSNLKPVKNLAAINAVDVDIDNDKPHFSSRSAAPGSGGAAKPTAGSAPADSPPADDPDRPTLHRSGSSGSGSDTSASTNSGSTPADDPDRPTLRRHSAADSNQASRASNDNVTPVGSLNDDPNRPKLVRGKPTGSLNESDLPRLVGLPGEQDLHQIVAVSDAVDRQPHDFDRAWDDEAEHQAILGKMQAAARDVLKTYEAANVPQSAAPTPPPPSSHTANSKLRRGVAKETPPPPPEALLEEQLTGYTLSYGGAATFVYHAHTDGLGAQQRFVTLVAQVDTQGEPQVALKNVTDAAHLDRTPRMRLVDAVDAEASNRASLLFELRAQNSRQFALYRVIGGRADQIFLTGSTQ